MSHVIAIGRRLGLGIELGTMSTLEKVMAIGEDTYAKAS